MFKKTRMFLRYTSRVSSVFWMILISIGLSRAVVLEAQPEEQIDVGQLLNELPDYGVGKEFRVSPQNATRLKPLIIPELFHLVRLGQLEFSAFKKLRYAWSLGDDWEQASRKREISLAQNFSLPEVRLGKRLLFGTRSVLNSTGNSLPPGTLGQQILWNVHSNLWSQKVVQTSMLMRFVKDQRMHREVRAQIARVYPNELGVGPANLQHFRELVRFEHPEPIQGYTWLTFRFLANAEDIVWVYSPMIAKARQLTGSNRTDSMVASALSLDDLFVWSGKPALADVKSISSVASALVPFAGIDLGTASKASKDCWLIEQTRFTASPETLIMQWNIGSRRFPQGAGWLPTEALWVPRELWRLEMVSKDPYSLIGRQIIYVDSESMLPVFRFVFDRAGTHWKSIIPVWGLAQEGKNTFPYLQIMVVDDLKNRESYLIENHDTQYCGSLPETLQLTSFDPSKLGAASDKAATDTNEPSAVPTLEAPAADDVSAPNEGLEAEEELMQQD